MDNPLTTLLGLSYKEKLQLAFYAHESQGKVVRKIAMNRATFDQHVADKCADMYEEGAVLWTADVEFDETIPFGDVVVLDACSTTTPTRGGVSCSQNL